MPFEKGQSGNPGGRPKHKLWRSAIERALERRHDEKLDLRGIDMAADVLVDKALIDRDTVALKEIGDRMDGKAPQAITGEDGGPIETKDSLETTAKKLAFILASAAKNTKSKDEP